MLDVLFCFAAFNAQRACRLMDAHVYCICYNAAISAESGDGFYCHSPAFSVLFHFLLSFCIPLSLSLLSQVVVSNNSLSGQQEEPALFINMRILCRVYPHSLHSQCTFIHLDFTK